MIEMGENQLIDTENLFKAIYNDSPIGIELYNSNGKLIDLNQSCMELFGVSDKGNIKGFDLLNDPNIPKEHLNKLKQKESVHYESLFNFDLVKRHKLYQTMKTGKIYLDVLITPLLLGEKNSISNYLVQIQDITVQKIAEQKLIESEEKFRSITEQSIMGICIVQDDIVKYANHQIADIYGYSIEEIMNWSPYEFLKLIDPEYRDIVVEQAKKKQLGQDDVIKHYQLKCIKKTGEKFWVDNFSRTINYNGKTADLVTLIDITEERKAENELKVNKQLLETTIYNLQDAIFILDHKIPPKVINCNPASEKIFGYSRDEIIGNTTAFLHIDENSLKNFQKAVFPKLQQFGNIYNYEFKMKRNNGTIFPTEHAISELRNENGEAIGFVSLVRDITDRKKAEEKIQYQAKLVDEVSDAIISTDLDFNIISWNKAAESIYEWNEEEVIGENIRDNIAVEYPYDKEEDVIRQFFEDGSWKGEVIQYNRDGLPINILSSVSLIEDITGKPTGAVAINRDITERKKAEEKIRESEKRLKDLIEAVPVGISITNLEGKIIECNSNMFKIFGYDSKDEFIEILASDHYYIPTDREKFIELAERGIVKDFTVEFKRKDGSVFWGSLTSSTQKDVGQTVFITSLQDITDRKLTEIKIQQSEAELSAIYNYAPIAILLVDHERRIRKINKFALKFTDRHEEEVLGIHGGEALRCLYSIIDPKGCGFSEYCQDCTIRNSVLDTLKTRTPYINVEATLNLLPGGDTNKVHLLISTVPLKFDGEDLVLISLIDITDRKNAEQKLQESEARFKYLVSSNPAIIYTSKTSGDFGATFISKNVKQLAGYTPEQFVTYSNFWIDHIHPNDKEHVLTNLSNLYERGYLAHEYRFKFKDNTYHWMRDELKLIIDESGNYSEIIGFWIDITEKKIAEEKLKESEERYRSFIENFQGIAFQGYKDFSAAFFHGSVEEITGYQEDDFVSGRIKWNQILHPDDLPEINEKIEKFHESALETDKREYRIIHKNGDIRSLIEYNQKFFDPIINKEGVRGVIINNTKFKEAERLLIESEEKYRKLFNNAPFAIVLFNTEGHFFDCNEATFQITGYHKEELLGRNFTEFEFYTDLKVARLEKRETLIKHGAIPPPREILLNKKDKTQFWARTYLDFIHIGNKNYIQAIVQDVTQQKIAEDKLKDSEERFKYLISSSPTIIYTAKASGDYGATFISNNVEEKWGYDPDIFVHDSEFWLNHVHPDDKEHVLTMLSDISEKNYIIYEYRFKLNDGNYHWMRDEVMLVRDDSGNPVETIGSVIDITERVEAELELKNSEEKFRTIAEQSTLGVMIQQDGLIKFVNKAFSEILEYPLEEISNWTEKDTFKVIHEEDVHIVKEKSRTRKEGDYDKTISYECRIITKSGQAKWVEVMSKPIKYFGRYAILISTIDTTARKKVEEELMEVSRLKSELLSRTSHELKTPLVSIKGYADLLLSQHYEELDFYTISVLHEMKQGCNRLESLIKDLIETSKLETGEVDLNKTKDDLTFLIKFCVRDLKGLIETRNHTLVMDIQDSMITLIEKERIYEVVINLLSNAIKYTPPNGRIIIKSESKDNTYIVSIKDNGIGLTNEEKEKIFKKFGKIERYGKGLDVVSEGSGLGLYISKKIIELHGGDIWVESKGRDKGSKFSFSIPILKE